MAKAAKSAKKAPTKSQLYASISETTGVSKKDVAAVFDALFEEVKKNLGARGPGQFTIPGMIKLTKKKVPARPAQKNVRNPFTGELQDRPAKPASSKVQARPLKAVKDLV